jgi:TonB-linked SusC/RagA family outer membrane protein
MKNIYFFCKTVLFLVLFGLLIPDFAIGQNRITGIVTDESQLPLPGVSVLIKGTNIGTTTQADGSFSLNAQSGQTLVFRFLGSQTQEILIGSESTITVQLKSDTKALSEVVVTASGIRKEAKKLTYAVQEIKTTDLIKAREPNAINSLKGKVAGLVVNVNSELLRAPSLNFRGEGDILFVVDGVPITTDTWNISPDDIESYSFLKGQAASALYGSLARNGAIIINTKKGTSDNRGFAIEFNSSTMVDDGFLALPIYQDTYGPGSRGKYAFGNGNGSGINDADYDVWGPRFDGQLLPQYDGKVDATKSYLTTFADGSTFTGIIEPTPWTARGANNLENFLKPGLLLNNHIAISSAGENYNLRFGVGNSYQEAIVPNMNLTTTNFNMTAGYDFSKKVRITADINYSRQSSPNIPDVNYGPNSMIYNIVIWAGADWNVNDMKNYWQPGKIGTQQIFSEYQRYNNPYFMVNEWLRPHSKNDVYGYLSLNYKIAKSLELTYRPSISTYNIFRQEKMPVSSGAYGRDERLGDYREDTRSFFDANNEVQLKYKSNFLKDFLSVDGLVGGNIRNARYKGTNASTDYLSVPGLYNLSNSLRPGRSNSLEVENLFLSAFYSVDLGLGKYATLNSTGRLDKASTLPLTDNTFYYPSFGVATSISDYVTLPKAISFLKLRGSYAEGRNAGINSSVGQALLGYGSGEGYGNQYYTPVNMGLYELTSSGYNISSSGGYNNALNAGFSNTILEPGFQADNKKTTEAGLDLRFFKDRLNFDATWYNSKSELLSDRTDIISQASGFNAVKTNYGSYKNTGLELVLSGTPVNKNFKWNIAGTWSTYKRTWIKNPNPSPYIGDGDRVDLVIGEGYIRTPDGQLVHGSDGTLLRFRDAGQGNARRIFGHADPDWTWGIVNSFGYKNFRLSFQFDGVVGGVFNDYVRQKTLQGGRHIETATGLWGEHRMNDATGGSLVAPGITLTGGAIALDPVTGEIINFSSLQVQPNTTATSVQSYSSRYSSLEELSIIDKTFAKLREVTFTYTLPSSLLSRIKFVKKAEASLIGRNLYLFFPEKYKDVDPDQFTQRGGSDLQTPSTRRFGFNLNLTF